MKRIINIHKNNPAIILAHGPSLDLIKPKLTDIFNKGYVVFGCNEWFHLYNIFPHYWVMCSNQDTIPKHEEIVKRYSGIVFYSDSVDLSDKEKIDSITNNYITFDQRHFKGKKCNLCNSYGCGKYFNPNRLTLQEYLQRYTNHSIHYGTGSSVALHMLAISILMGCNPIYLIGVHINYKIGYAQNNANLIGKVNVNEFDYYKNEILNDFKIINDSAKNINVNIYDLNQESILKDIFQLKGIEEL